MRLLWEEEAWEDYCLWQTRDKKLLKRINSLIKQKDCCRPTAVFLYYALW